MQSIRLFEGYLKRIGREPQMWDRQFISCFLRCDPLRDPSFVQYFLTSLVFYWICFPLMVLIFMLIFAFTFVDLLFSPRFFLFRRSHIAFLESVMVAHPELDPTVIEEELFQQLQQLLETLCRKHPGVYYSFFSTVVHHHNGSGQSYDEDVFEIHFMKFAPEHIIHAQKVLF